MERVKFGDVVKRVNIYVDRFNTDRLYYVGKGGSIEPNALDIKPIAKIEGATIGFKFHFGFNPGHILFMSRCFDQHKAATATFAGVCSDSTYVVETRDEKVLLQSYLQLVMQTDDFWNWCEEHKSGGVNFLINYSTLETYEFDLPSLEEQKVLADKLWAAYKVKESYRQLLTATDDMLQAKFQKMFGEIDGEEYAIKDLFVLQMGKTPERKNASYWDNGTHKWFSIADMSKSDIYSGDTDEYISDIAVKETGIKTVKKGTIFMSFKLTIGKVLVASEDIFTNEAIMAFVEKQPFDSSNGVQISKKWLFYCFVYKDWLENAAQAVKGNTLNKESIGNSKIILPKYDKQQEFATIATQAEATKASLRESIASIDRVIRSIINQ